MDTLGYLSDLNNLIGKFAISDYSPLSEWIMCELGVFPLFQRTIF